MDAINLSGVTHIIISKVDILEKVNIFKYYYRNTLLICNNIIDLQTQIEEVLTKNCKLLKYVEFSDNPNSIKVIST